MPENEFLDVPDDLDEYGDPRTESAPEVEDDHAEDAAEQVDDAETETEQDEPVEEPEAVTETAPQTKGEKSAHHAEQRRLREQQQRTDMLEQLKRESPEFKVAQELATMYGIPVEQLQQRLVEARIAKQAEQQNVPVEVVKQQHEANQEITQLKQTVNVMQFKDWKNRVDTEAKTLQTEYSMLSDEDMTEAQNYLLTKIKNPEMPLEQAVMALHGPKIMKHIKEQQRTEALAEVSGRKKGALAPQSSKTADTVVLSADQQAAAKMLGMSEADYIKWSVD